jgi:hypothetical protein
MAKVEFREKKDITTCKIENSQRIASLITADDAKLLRQKALDNDTTVSEIIRVLVTNYLHPKKESK